MQSSAIPAKFTLPFANSATAGFIRAIPATSADPNAASFTLGFPPNTFNDISAGGVPPDGRDFNGIFNQLSAWARWMAAGGSVLYDAAFSTSIGGYPKNAILCSTTPGIFWQSTAENNATNPDSGGSANWIQVAAPKASAAEIVAGTVDTKFVTPKGLHDAGAVFITSANPNPTSGYRISSDGYKEMWGDFTAVGNGSTTVGYPLNFSSWSRAYVNGGNASSGQQDNGPFVTFSGTDHCQVYSSMDFSTVCSFRAFGY